MRTQNITKAEFSQLRNKISDLVSGHRNYNVRGIITFVFTWHSVEPDLEQLHAAILEADKAFPWHDDPYPDVSSESIRYLSDGDVKVDNWTVPEKSCWFYVYPVIDNLRRTQVYAYEKYLAKLAEDLAKMKLPNVKEVRSIIEMRASTIFRVKTSN